MIVEERSIVINVGWVRKRKPGESRFDISQGIDSIASLRTETLQDADTKC